LKSHTKGAKHIQLLKMRHSDPGVLRIRDVLVSASPSRSSMTESEPVASVSTLQKRRSANDEHEESSSQSVSASHIVTTSEVFSSELLWAIQTCMSHFSYRSCSQTGSLFQRMFPDSKTAKKFSLGKTKYAHCCCC